MVFKNPKHFFIFDDHVKHFKNKTMQISINIYVKEMYKSTLFAYSYIFTFVAVSRQLPQPSLWV